MIRMRLLMAAIAIAAVSTTGCSPKVVGDSSASSVEGNKNINTEAKNGTDLISEKQGAAGRPSTVQGSKNTID